MDDTVWRRASCADGPHGLPLTAPAGRLRSRAKSSRPLSAGLRQHDALRTPRSCHPAPPSRGLPAVDACVVLQACDLEHSRHYSLGRW